MSPRVRNYCRSRQTSAKSRLLPYRGTFLLSAAATAQSACFDPTKTKRVLSLSRPKDQILNHTGRASSKSSRPRGLELRPVVIIHLAAPDVFETGRFIFRWQIRFKIVRSKIGQAQAFDLGLVAFGIDPDDYLQEAVRRGDAVQRGENNRFAGRDSAKQASPGKMYVNFVGNANEFFR